ncbi:transmembrane protein 127-like, partial [Saccoglossus kowalevskii]|uniref:Transmembrane protein 127-like n=1 Tax=Saccoglossus kowalevskii TaxID=10224 RepID=A0ABM0MDF1_SACKO
MELCVTEKIAGLMRVVIAFCFVGIGTSLFGFILDTFGPSKRILKIIRRHGIGNIVTVVLCAAINLFCYWISDLIDEHLNANKRGTGSLVKVQFDIGYYLIAGAGGLSVIVVATNMLRRYPMYDDSGDDGIDDWENEFVNLPASFTPPPPPPPAYTP